MQQRQDNAISMPADMDIHKLLWLESSNNMEAFHLGYMWYVDIALLQRKKERNLSSFPVGAKMGLRNFGTALFSVEIRVPHYSWTAY